MRYVFGFLCVCALGVMPLVGCTESKQQEPDLEWPPNATAYFDQYGILNADCATDEDCAMVLGYYHAADRFVQMDFRRRFATGRLTEIMDKAVAQVFGVAEIAAQSRALFSTRDGQPVEDFVLEQASDKTVAMLEAYSAGVNQWIDEVRNGQNDAVFPREFEGFPFTYGPEDVPEWRPTDSIAAVLAAIDRESNLEEFEVRAGLARVELEDDDRFFDLWATRPLESSILPPGWMPPSDTQEPSAKQAPLAAEPHPGESLPAGPALRRLEHRLERTGEIFHSLLGTSVGGGSNNWVIAPSRSETGKALLAYDPHLALTQPTENYFAHLDAKTNGSGQIHTAGATSPALPWVLSGQNENIAWGSTRTFLDMSDLYIEQLVKDADGNPMGVMFQNEVVPFTRVAFTVTFNDGSTEDHELLFVPHHGAVREIDLDNDVAIALRWTGNDTDTDMEYPGALNAAGTVLEARTALENSTTRGGSFVVIDTEGNIGWFPYNRVPKRTWATDLLGDASPMLPLDGRCETPDRCYEWTEYFDYAELPQALNPSEGFIVTANNDMTGHLFDADPTNDGYAPLQSLVVPGFRHARIVDLIGSIGSEHTTTTMHQIQHDLYSLIGELELPTMLEIAESEMTTLTEPGQKILRALKAWELTCPTGVSGYYTDSPLKDDPQELGEASGCAAYHAARAKCDLTPKHQPAPYTQWMFFYSLYDPSRLRAGDVYWDDPATPETETKYQVIGECFDEAGRLLMDELGLGDDETKWAWGRVQGMVLSSDLSSFGITAYSNPPPGEPLFANAGGVVTVSPTNPALESSGFVQRAGSMQRLICEALPTGPSCTLEVPGGQSGHIDSPNYDDLLFKYLDGEPIDLVFDINEAKANAVRTVTFE